MNGYENFLNSLPAELQACISEALGDGTARLDTDAETGKECFVTTEAGEDSYWEIPAIDGDGGETVLAEGSCELSGGIAAQGSKSVFLAGAQ